MDISKNTRRYFSVVEFKVLVTFSQSCSKSRNWKHWSSCIFLCCQSLCACACAERTAASCERTAPGDPQWKATGASTSLPLASNDAASAASNRCRTRSPDRNVTLFIVTSYKKFLFSIITIWVRTILHIYSRNRIYLSNSQFLEVSVCLLFTVIESLLSSSYDLSPNLYATLYKHLSLF